MSLSPPRVRTPAITWMWPEAIRGAICALPGAVILLEFNVSLGICFALGTLPVAMLGVPPARNARPRLVAAGFGFAVVYALGCLIGQWAIVAVACVTAFAYAAVLFASRKPAARLLPAILVPAFALGMNEPVPDGFAIAGMFVGGSVWAVLVAYCWPEKAVPARGTAQSPAGSPDRGVVRTYAFAFASAAGIGLAIGFLFDLAHVAWAAAAAMFIMRPDPGLLATRALGRVAATFAGILAAALVVRRGPTEVALALIVVCALAAMIGTRTSRWYVASGATGLVVLLMAGVTSTREFEVSFRDRLGETAIGAALALAFGVALPTAARRLRARHV